jgi:hypothetical protein
MMDSLRITSMQLFLHGREYKCAGTYKSRHTYAFIIIHILVNYTAAVYTILHWGCILSSHTPYYLHRPLNSQLREQRL